MTSYDWARFYILIGWVAARLSEGDFKLALYNMAFGVLLMLVLHPLDRLVFGK